MQVSQSPEEDVGCPVTGLTGGYEPPDVDAVNPAPVLYKSTMCC